MTRVPQLASSWKGASQPLQPLVELELELLEGELAAGGHGRSPASCAGRGWSCRFPSHRRSSVFIGAVGSAMAWAIPRPV
jgi:hypothetical protein